MYYSLSYQPLPYFGKEGNWNLLQASQREEGGRMLVQRHTHFGTSLSKPVLLGRESGGKEKHLPPK